MIPAEYLTLYFC